MCHYWVRELAVSFLVFTSWTIFATRSSFSIRVPVMGLDFVLVLLAGYKSIQHYRHVPDKTWFGARLMRVFARDSIIYFFW